MTTLNGANVLVLGGSVFVGRHLVEQLLAAGANVSVLNRGQTPADFAPEVERIVADRTDAAQMTVALGGRDFDKVFDVSGFVMAAGGSDMNHLVQLLEGRVGSYVYTSSIMAYDQSWQGVFPWTEDQPTNPEGPTSYGGFKAVAEASLLEHAARSGFPASIVRPAAIYGPHNNIFDMETPMFLRLLQNRPILVPHGGLVVGSYGHVADLCRAMITISQHPDARGQVFNISGQSVDVNRYISILADIVQREPNVVSVPDSLLPVLDSDGLAPAFGHLFKIRHHAMLSMDKARAMGIVPQYDLVSGHEHTYEWFQSMGWHNLSGALKDPVWKASWDFDREAEVAERIRRAN